jgi:hypothetical protein
MSRKTGTTLRPDQGPWRTTHCEAYYFLLDANRAVLQNAVDLGLNSLAGGPRFQLTVGAVAMTLQQFSNMKVVPAGATSPVINYPEAAFFVMVSDTYNLGKIYIWTPFMYCGNTLATISGREVFGFPKELSEIHLDGKQFSVFADGLQAPQSDDPASFVPSPLPILRGGIAEPLIEHEANPLSGNIDIDKLREDKALEGLGGLWAMFGGLTSATGQWISVLIDPAINFVLDRSRFDLPSATWRTELVRARSPVHQLSLQRFLAPTEFQVAQAASHPVMAQLGLVAQPGTSDRVRPLLGCKLVLDFSLQPPQVLG